jgi:hypothetical protein
MSKRTIAELQWNKAGLAPCDHAWAMRRAYFDERDRLLAKGKRKASDAADAHGIEWLREWERLVRARHGVRDLTMRSGLACDTVWVGTAANGDKAIYRYYIDGSAEEGFAIHTLAENFLSRIALENARTGLQGYELSGESTVTFTVARKREVKRDGRYVLEDTGYRETQWDFGSAWNVKVTVKRPEIVGDALVREQEAWRAKLEAT